MTDYTVGDTLHIAFTTRAFATGIPTTLAGTPVVSAYEDASTTEITAGITLGVDHDSKAGLNMLTIVASGANGYEAGKDYHLVVTTGTVSSVSVVGEVVGRFTLGRSAAAVDLANGTDGLGAIKAVADSILAAANVLVPLITTVTITNQTTGVLAEGSADDNAYKDWKAFFIDQSTATQVCLGHVSSYVGSTKTYTLKADPGIFTVATGDTIALVPPGVTFGLSEVAAAFNAIFAHIDLFTTDTSQLLATAEPGSLAGQLYTLIQAIKDIADLLPDAGALTSIAQEATLGEPAGASVSADIAAAKSDTAAVLLDTAELQADWADGGRLDLILDARASQSSVNTVDGIVDTIVAKTNSLTFTVANQVNANVKYVNDMAVGGNGSEDTPWGPA